MKLMQVLPRFEKAYAELEHLDEMERLSRDEIDAVQLARLNDVWSHAIVHVPYYRDLCEQLSLPRGFGTLAEYRLAVPVLSKDSVRNDRMAFLSEEPAPGRWHRTGGSTGSPMSTYWGRDSHQEMLRAKYRYLAMWDVDILDRTAYLWGHSASFQPGLAGRIAKIRQPIEDRLRNRLRLSAYQLGPRALREYLRRIEAFRPVSLYGYSSALYLLAREAEASGFDCDSLKLFTLTAEPSTQAIVDKIESVFSVPAAREYGSIECGLIASEWRDRTLRVREDVTMVETLPRSDGRHDIVISVLNNPSFPLLRYAIADVTDAPIDRPEQGFAILENVAGRHNDFVATQTGNYLHFSRFDALFKYHSKAIRRFRVRQRANGSIWVGLELDQQAPPLDVPVLEQAIVELVDGYPVNVEIVDSLPQSVAGKHRVVTSQILELPSRTAMPKTADALPSTGDPSGTATGTPISTDDVRAELQPDTRTDAGADASVHVVAVARPESHPSSSSETDRKATLLKQLIQRPELGFLMEAHNGLSARIVQEAGFEAIWASGLSMSAALGVRDSNEASWTQVLEVLEFMSDATRIPILVDGDTGYGNFNNMRRLVQKLEMRGIAGVCIEDKLFPKMNSFIRGTTQPLAEIDEFCGRISAGKDAQATDDFVIVARVEAFIAGWGLKEALKRAEAYRDAGADAILMHSAKRSPLEVLSFMREWGDRLPVVIVPTKYYTTPTDVFREHGVAAVIWANHLMRTCITAMQRTAQQIVEDESLLDVEDVVAPLAEVFRIQGAGELLEAEKRYLPRNAKNTRAIVLAASKGKDLGDMTVDRPKCMVHVSGRPILSHIIDTYRAAGVKDIHVVRGYKSEAVTLEGLSYHENDDPLGTSGAYSLHRAADALEGDCIVSLGDVLFRKYIAEGLMETDADLAVFVDGNWKESRNRGRHANYVTCSEPHTRKSSFQEVELRNVGSEIDVSDIHGEWMGFLKLSADGARFVQELLKRLAGEPDRLRGMTSGGLLREILAEGKTVRVLFTAGHWFDIDSVDDLLEGSTFQ